MGEQGCSQAFELDLLRFHNYLEAGPIPDRCVLQIHWYREPNFQRFLFENRFKVVSIARHPLDVLISILHFIRYDQSTENAGSRVMGKFPPP